MTKEEIQAEAKQYAENAGGVIYGAIYQAYLDGVLSDTARKHWEPKWITVTPETIPELNEPVLVRCKIYGRFIATYEDIGAGKNWGNWRDSNGNLGILPPTHWMPLPTFND